ncbi:MAG: PaaI family thioesterase [Candidatus Hydrogenedentes bacterium]|nr:PaaI family thioesterase [Candidatus Hydrogenedentota bacterium]
MANDDHFRKLENMYHHAPCNTYYQPTLTISEGAAEWVLSVRPEFFHAAGAVHGSVYFKGLDDSAFFAANSLVEDVFVLTVQFTVYLTRPITSGEMRASAQVVSRSQNLIIAEAVLRDSDNREIGRGSGSFMRSKIALTLEIGYRLP